MGLIHKVAIIVVTEKGRQMIDKLIKKLIKKLVNWKYKRDGFWAWSWGVDEHVDIHILTEESYLDRHRFGTREEIYDK